MAAITDEIGAFEAKTRLSELLRACERGHSFTIRRRGKIVARLVPASDEAEGAHEHEPGSLAESFGAVRARIGHAIDVRALVRQGRQH
jgi:prevent-host-death family protein